MKRVMAVLVIGAALCFAAAAGADESAAKGKAAAAPATATLKGEIVDTGCYLGHEARGEKHMSCATKCIANGMPMGLLTADGKLYLLTMNHDNPDAFNQAKNLAAKQVEATGFVLERAGMKALDLVAIKPVAAK
jgi:type 1 fimbria pilin